MATRPLKTPPADLPRLAPRGRDTSKRDYGRVVVVGGSSGMAGAPALAAIAALKSGAGLVEAIVPNAIAAITAGFDPCVMTRGLPSAPDGTFADAALPPLRDRLAAADAVALGPGLGRSQRLNEIVREAYRDLPQPMVVDADALYAVAHLDAAARSAHAGPRILTPHAGEMLRLLGVDPSSDRGRDRPWLEARAAELARSIDVVVVLKGPATLVVDSTRAAHNDTGNPGMATGGTGDVLTGMIAALLAQGLPPYDAARLATWLHGLAGDFAARDLGEISLTARDLLDRVPEAFVSLGRG